MRNFFKRIDVLDKVVLFALMLILSATIFTQCQPKPSTECEPPCIEALQTLIVGQDSLVANIEGEGAAVSIECRDCKFNLSGRAFQIDSIRRGATFYGLTLQYYIIDDVYNFKTWIRTPGANNPSMFVECDYSEADYDNGVDPCNVTAQITPLERLVKIAVVTVEGDIKEIYPSGYTGSGSNIVFYYGEDTYRLDDPFVVLVCP